MKVKKNNKYKLDIYSYVYPKTQKQTPPKSVNRTCNSETLHLWAGWWGVSYARVEPEKVQPLFLNKSVWLAVSVTVECTQKTGFVKQYLRIILLRFKKHQGILSNLIKRIWNSSNNRHKEMKVLESTFMPKWGTNYSRLKGYGKHGKHKKVARVLFLPYFPCSQWVIISSELNEETLAFYFTIKVHYFWRARYIQTSF